MAMPLLAMMFVFGNSTANGQSFTEGFDNVVPTDWLVQNNSSPVGTASWFTGNTLVFPAHSGAPTSYAGVNFNSGAGVATISNWLISPNRVFRNGDTIRFYTRTVSTGGFPDRLQVRLSTAGTSTRVGSNATSVGDFSNLLLDINPTYTTNGYPSEWTLQTITIAGLTVPTSGRFAFRYFVENAGPSGLNSDYIGIDTLTYSSVGPTAASVSISGRVLAAGGSGLSNAEVYLTDAYGNVLVTRTGSFGTYRINGIEAGQTVVLTINSKRFQYHPRALTLSDELTGIDFEPIDP